MARRWWCGDDGIASFARIRYRRHDASAFLYAFDLIELNGDDLRREALAARKATLASLLALASSGLRFNEHMAHDDSLLVFAHACKLRLDRIVSKRRDLPYRSGRRKAWVKTKYPAHMAVLRLTMSPRRQQVRSPPLWGETRMKIDGRCHCGYVTFEAEADPETTTICNCTDCQTMSGAPLRAVIITQPGTFVLL